VAPMLAALIDVGHLVEVAGYPLLFVLVMCESGGIPLPGETALITAALLASNGKLEIEFVIAIAAAAAIIGDNLGYLVSRKGGRYLLVLDQNNTVEQRKVTIGPRVGDLRVIESGLKPDDRIVVAGILRAVPGQKVDPQLETLAATPASAAGGK